MKVVFEPALAAEITEMASRGNADRQAEYRASQDQVYLEPPERRKDGFYGLDCQVLARWGLAGPVNSVTGEFSALGGKTSEVLVARVASAGEEGADLSWDGQRIGVKVKAHRFLDGQGLSVFLRHELMHVQDMLDEKFGYRLERLDLTPAQDAKFRERYGLLWDISIESRLAGAGKQGTANRDEWAKRFQETFTDLPDEVRPVVFQRLWDRPQCSHLDILEKALDPAKFVGWDGKPEVRVPGAKCPLCRFPSYQWVDAPAPALALVQAEFPRWQPEQGMCPRCSEYYAVRVGIW